MRPITRCLSTLTLLTLALPALAADKKKDEDDDEVEVEKGLDVDESDFKEEGDDDAPPPARLEEDDKAEEEGDELDFDDEDDTEALKFTDEDDQKSVQPRQPGEDTAQIYRDGQKKVKDMSPDEEQIFWEDYLKRYPKSLFADRIETRMDELSVLMFGDRVEGSDIGARAVDAADRELNLTVPMKTAPVDTRTHVSVGAEWGFPSWASGQLDVEYAFLRQASAHLSLERDFAGAAISPGARYALIKSSRTGTVLSGGLDFKINAGPTFMAFRPTVGFGQRLRVMEGLDIQANMAIDVETREDSDLRWSWALVGGLRPNEIVSVFWEWNWDAKYLSNPDVDTFTFFTTNLGLKFQAKKATNEQGDGKIDVGIGASFPYTTNYWGFYAGSVNFLGDFYF